MVLTPNHVIRALQNDTKYAKAIASLAKIRTADVPGISVLIGGKWEGTTFASPYWLSLIQDFGTLSWSPDKEPRLAKLVLRPLVSVLAPLSIPPCPIQAAVVVSEVNKKPYFQKFVFPTEVPILPPHSGLVSLSGTTWELNSLEETIRKLRKYKRKLKGMGLV